MRARLLGSFVLMFALAAPALAQDRRGGASLDRVLPHVRQTVPGRFYDAEGPFFGSNGHPTYRLKWMTPDGRIIWFSVDAQTGQVLGGMPRYRADDRGPSGWGNGSRNNWQNNDGDGWGDGGGWGGRGGDDRSGQGDWGGRGGDRGQSGGQGNGQGGQSGGWGGRSGQNSGQNSSQNSDRSSSRGDSQRGQSGGWGKRGSQSSGHRDGQGSGNGGSHDGNDRGGRHRPNGG